MGPCRRSPARHGEGDHSCRPAPGGHPASDVGRQHAVSLGGRGRLIRRRVLRRCAERGPVQGRVGRQSRGGAERQVKLAVRKKDWDASPSDPIMKRPPCRLRREARLLAGTHQRTANMARYARYPSRSRSASGSAPGVGSFCLTPTAPKKKPRQSSCRGGLVPR